MTWIMAILTGFFFGLAIWLLLQRAWLKILFGVILLGHGANLAVLSSTGNPLGKETPITNQMGNYVDPLPQALLLTAIVISFAVVAYFISLLYRIFNDTGKSDLDTLFADQKGDGK